MLKKNNQNCKISIVVPSFNQGKFIERALQSLENQHDDNLEIIVMDAGSTDNSVDVIKKYEHIITYWQSQKDGGQSAAINEGVRRSTGDFIVWFNTDDIMMPNAIANLRRCIAKHPDSRWFAGSQLWIDANDIIIRVGRQERMGKLFDSSYFISAGPSAFMRRDMLDDVGLLREDFHYIMDLELWYRLISHREYMERIPGYTWALRVHEDSKTNGRFAQDTEAYKRHEQKIQIERNRLMEMYPNKTLYRASSWRKIAYYLNKLFDRATISQIVDRRLLDKHIGEI